MNIVDICVIIECSCKGDQELFKYLAWPGIEPQTFHSLILFYNLYLQGAFFHISQKLLILDDSTTLSFGKNVFPVDSHTRRTYHNFAGIVLIS